MGRILMRAGGGLTRADKAKLVPGNIREGVTLFSGTVKEITGTLKFSLYDYLSILSGHCPWSGTATFDITGNANLVSAKIGTTGSYGNRTVDFTVLQDCKMKLYLLNCSSFTLSGSFSVTKDIVYDVKAGDTFRALEQKGSATFATAFFHETL